MTVSYRFSKHSMLCSHYSYSFITFTGRAHIENDHGHPPPDVDRLEFLDEVKRKIRDPTRSLATAKELYEETLETRTVSLPEAARFDTLQQ